MSLNTDIETEILGLLDSDVMGRSMVIGSSTVIGILSPDDFVPPGMPGGIVERYRLLCSKASLTAIVGNELVVDGKTYLVVAAKPLELLTDITIERYTA